MPGIVVIGAGECGVRACFALREKGYAGSITLIGDETGSPYERPPLSKNLESERKPIRGEQAFSEAGIDLRHGVSATGIDRLAKAVELSDGTRISYETLLLAMGARARLFPGMQGCLTLRTHADALAIAARLSPGARIGIIGGGFIGLELAAIARQVGAEVTVIEAGPRLLGRAIPEAIAAVIQARHEWEGVTVRTSAGVASCSASAVLLTDGAALSFDTIIAGVGASPNTAVAEAAGIDVSNGIVVDAHFRTSDPSIFAAGDCCNFTWRGERLRLESWKAAQDQGAHAAAAMLGADDDYGNVPWFWSDQYDLTLHVAGVFDLSRPVHSRPTGDGATIVFQCESDGRLRAVAGVGRGNAVAKDIKILEKLIGRGALVEPATLSDPTINLKGLLKEA